MTFKYFFIFGLLTLSACKRSDIIERHVITDISSPESLFYTTQRENSIVHYKIKGTMDGTVGYVEGNCLDSTRFPSFGVATNLIKVDSIYKEDYYRIFGDSILAEGGCEGTQAGAMYCLHFTPGTATNGKIEVEFREYGYGF